MWCMARYKFIFIFKKKLSFLFPNLFFVSMLQNYLSGKSTFGVVKIPGLSNSVMIDKRSKFNQLHLFVSVKMFDVTRYTLPRSKCHCPWSRSKCLKWNDCEGLHALTRWINWPMIDIYIHIYTQILLIMLLATRH